MRKFTGIDFMTESVPDETTPCKFRHLLEANGLNKLFFDANNRVMVQTGHMMSSIVPSLTTQAPRILDQPRNVLKPAARRLSTT